jgi:superfamily I DNA/RNA helicase
VKIRIVEHDTDRSEAEFVARAIESMIGGLRFFSLDSRVSDGERQEGIGGLSDFAVLARIGRQLAPLEKAFRDHAIPCQVVGELPFFRQEPARTLLDLLRLSLQPDSRDLAARLAARPGLEGALRRARAAGSVAQAITALAGSGPSDSGGAEPEEGLQRLLDLAAGYGNDVEGFLRMVTLGDAVDAYQARAERVALMTLHAAKGLEFPCVFIVGCEDGLLPYTLFGHPGGDPEEERRLLYVGMTRARRWLYLSHARARSLFGRKLGLPRSPYLEAIERELTEASRAGFRRRPAGEDRQLDLF